jgi:hypothetical protein
MSAGAAATALMVVEQAARLRNEVATRVTRPGEATVDAEGLRYRPSMSESSNEKAEDTEGISDEQLPEDLQPSEDNPLAEPLTDEEAPDDMDELDMMGGGTEKSDDGESDADDDQD